MTDSVSPRPLFPKSGPCHTHTAAQDPQSTRRHNGPTRTRGLVGPPHAQDPAGYPTGFHTAHRSDVNCPSDDAIVTVIDLADVAKLLSMMSPPSDVRSQ